MKDVAAQLHRYYDVIASDLGFFGVAAVMLQIEGSVPLF